MRRTSFAPNDYQAVCDFLIALNANDKTHINWNWARWEWMYAHPYFDREKQDAIALWWDANRIVGVAVYDLYFGEAFCAALHGYEKLLPDIYAYTYDRLRDENGVGIAVADTDTASAALLISMGYEKTEQTEVMYFRGLQDALMYELPAGFTIREIHFPEDALAYKKVIYKGFDHEGDQAEWERMLQSTAPLPPHLEPRLCLAVSNGCGELFAHCTCWYENQTDYAYIEPVCTVPQYRGHGLARAVVSEALNRCRSFGAREAMVLSDQSFYQHLGFVPMKGYTFYWKK